MTDKQSNGKTCQLASRKASEPQYVKLLMKITKQNIIETQFKF